jgi:hypothetical protein
MERQPATLKPLSTLIGQRASSSIRDAQSAIAPFISKKYTFEDGRSIKIIDVKLRDKDAVEWWVVYEIMFAVNSIPKRLQMSEKEFISSFRHLFFT